MNKGLVIVVSTTAFVVARPMKLFGVKTIHIPKCDQNNGNSWGENWISVKRSLFWDEVVEYEEGPCMAAYRVKSYGWSFGSLRIKYETI